VGLSCFHAQCGCLVFGCSALHVIFLYVAVIVVCVSREFYWANYATGLGAALHELGHTFDLAHSPTGIMSRGFDDIHRFFTIVSPVTSFQGVTASPCRAYCCYSPITCSATQSPVWQPAAAVCHSIIMSTV